MENKEILEKAIQKAIDGGWEPVVDGKFTGLGDNQFTGELHLAHDAPWNNGKWALGQSVASVLIDPDFAKALWPGEYGASGSVDPRAVSISTARPLIATWKKHLMEMVIADDPIAYLGENL